MLKWIRVDTQTRWRFVLIYGVAMWGGLSALILTILEFTRSPQDVSLPRLLSIWITFPPFGVLWGLAMHWWLHRKLLQRKAVPDPRADRLSR